MFTGVIRTDGPTPIAHPGLLAAMGLDGTTAGAMWEHLATTVQQDLSSDARKGIIADPGARQPGRTDPGLHWEHARPRPHRGRVPGTGGPLGGRHLLRMKLVLTCEHGGNQVPQAYRHLFRGAQDMLNSHRGWDPGALDLYEALLPQADAGWSATVTRLLVELNRRRASELFSEYSRVLGPAERSRCWPRITDPSAKLWPGGSRAS